MSRKRFYDHVRVTIAPRTLELSADDDDERLVRFHRRIYRRKTTPDVPVRSTELFSFLFVPEIGISSAFKLTAKSSATICSLVLSVLTTSVFPVVFVSVVSLDL